MFSRREFLKSTLGTGVALAAGFSQEAAAQPARRRLIVDAQVHMWKASTPDRPWVPGARPQLPEPFTIERLVPMMDEAGVDRVVVPPTLEGDRLDYAQEAVKRYPGRFAIMGRIALNDPTTARRFPTWREQPGVLGIRLNIAGEQAAWLTDGTADWFWLAAEKAGIPVMFLTTGQTHQFARIAERHSQLVLIIDHMGVVIGEREEQDGAGCDRPVGRARQVSERVREAVGGAGVFVRALSVPRRDPSYPSPVRCLRCAPLLLGNRHDQFIRQSHLPSADYPFHRGIGLLLGGRQRLDHGTRDCHAPGMGVINLTPIEASHARSSIATAG